MNADKLLDAVGGIRDEYIAEARAETGEAKKMGRRWARGLTAAACVCLMLVGAFKALQRFESFSTGCAAWAGTICDGTYYYSQAHSGLYRYTPESGSKMVIGTFWYDGCLANDYGVYYIRGRSLYVRPHDTGESRLLYRAGRLEASHMGMTLQKDGNIILTVYNKDKEYYYELLLDGRTGQELETLMEKTPFGSYRYSETHYWVGERELTLAATEEEYACDLLENGVSLLPGGVTVRFYWVRDYGDQIWFKICEENEDDETQDYFIVRADGDDELLTLPDHGYNTVVGDYAFFTLYEDGELYCVPQCLDIRTGESWVLETDADIAAYSFTTDGEYMYTCVPWDDWQACWKMVYDESGRPVALELVDEDITD